jgi:hypothetical protein
LNGPVKSSDRVNVAVRGDAAVRSCLNLTI